VSGSLSLELTAKLKTDSKVISMKDDMRAYLKNLKDGILLIWGGVLVIVAVTFLIERPDFCGTDALVRNSSFEGYPKSWRRA